MAAMKVNRRTGFRILPPQAQHNACGIDYPIGTSVSTPVAIVAAVTATAAAKPAETDPDADADRRSRWLVHLGRGRTAANDHDVVIRIGPARRLAVDPLLRRNRPHAPYRGIDLPV